MIGLARIGCTRNVKLKLIYKVCLKNIYFHCHLHIKIFQYPNKYRLYVEHDYIMEILTIKNMYGINVESHDITFMNLSSAKD